MEKELEIDNHKISKAERVAEICECSTGHARHTCNIFPVGGTDALKAVLTGRPKNSAKAASAASEIVTNGLTVGKSTQVMADELEACKDAGVDEYRYLATLDTRTYEMFRELDGKIFAVTEARSA